MPEFCTCGAQLPPESLFCHKCGKPQRAIVEPGVDPEAEPVAVVAEPVAVVAQALPLDFHNPVAVRIGGTVALVATLLSWIPALNLFLWLAAGFFAVIFYRRRTGALLNV